jgi:hypothetical protein
MPAKRMEATPSPDVNSAQKNRDVFLSGFDLVWTVVDEPNYLGGEKSLAVAVSHNRNTSSFDKEALTQFYKMGFPFTPTIYCNDCKRNQNTVDALCAKIALVEVAFEQAGIDLWDGTDDSKPFWVDHDRPFGRLHLSIGAWSALTQALLEQSWTVGTPAKVSVSLLMDSVKHHASGFLGLFKGFQVLTSRQAQSFINYCYASGLFEAGDPGPGGSLFENSLELGPTGHPLAIAHAFMWKYQFTRPERPHGWTDAIQGFGLRCYDCSLAANPDIVNDSRWQPPSQITSNSVKKS